MDLQKHESPRRSAGLGKRAIRACASRSRVNPGAGDVKTGQTVPSEIGRPVPEARTEAVRHGRAELCSVSSAVPRLADLPVERLDLLVRLHLRVPLLAPRLDVRAVESPVVESVADGVVVRGAHPEFPAAGRNIAPACRSVHASCRVSDGPGSLAFLPPRSRSTARVSLP